MRRAPLAFPIRPLLSFRTPPVIPNRSEESKISLQWPAHYYDERSGEQAPQILRRAFLRMTERSVIPNAPLCHSERSEESKISLQWPAHYCDEPSYEQAS